MALTALLRRILPPAPVVPAIGSRWERNDGSPWPHSVTWVVIDASPQWVRFKAEYSTIFTDERVPLPEFLTLYRLKRETEAAVK